VRRATESTRCRERATREPWPRFAVKAAALAAAMWLGASYAAHRYQIGIDPQLETCIPGKRVFLIDKTQLQPQRGRLVAFHARGMNPYFKDGTPIVKFAAALEGDVVEVDEAGVRVNGILKARGIVLAGVLGKPPQSFYERIVVPPNHVFAIGLTPKSFDSRYWGLVDESQIIGRAHAIL